MPQRTKEIRMDFEIGVADFKPYEIPVSGFFSLAYMGTTALPMRFSHSNGTYYLGNALPVASVFDGEWHNYDYSASESFHSDFSYYDVVLDLPEDYEACTSGYLERKETVDGRNVFHYTSDPIREFTIVFSNGFKILTKEWDGMKINVFYPKGKRNIAEECAEGTADVLSVYSQLFGSYLYKNLNLVEHPTVAMEFPCLVMVPFVEVSEHGGNIAGGLAHEISHQWWYAAVGNNQNDEPWLDEAFATYSNVLFYEMNGKSIDCNALGKRYREYIKSGGKDVPVAGNVWSFPLEGFSWIVYKKGACVLHMLRYVMGEENFFRSLREYYDMYRLKLVKTEDFIRVCEGVYGKSLIWFFDEWLYGTGVPQYDIRVKENRIDVRQKGKLFAMPLEFSVTYIDGRDETRKL